MTPAVKKAVIFLSFMVCSSEVASWIVDMAEVGKISGKDRYVIHPETKSDYDEASVASGNDDNEVVYTSNYAEMFQYRTFRKKEVESVIKNGAEYLERLSDSLAVYRATLDNCSSSAKTEEHTPKEELKTCETAERKERVVQKLSQMALTTTDKLRDKAFENTNQDDGVERTDLIRLAWSLDRLASLTGYRSPQDTALATRSTDIRQDDVSPVETAERTANAASEDAKQENLEILEQVENGRPMPRLPPTPPADTRPVQKRDIGDVMRYYVKYKVWDGSNPTDGHQTDDHDHRTDDHDHRTDDHDHRTDDHDHRTNDHDHQTYDHDHQTDDHDHRTDDHDHRTDDHGQFDVQNSLRALPVKKRSLTDKKSENMRSAIQKMRQMRCKPKGRPKKSPAKLVKSIKVYRRKIFKDTDH